MQWTQWSNGRKGSFDVTGCHKVDSERKEREIGESLCFNLVACDSGGLSRLFNIPAARILCGRKVFRKVKLWGLGIIWDPMICP